MIFEICVTAALYDQSNWKYMHFVDMMWDCCQVLEELSLDAELNILQAYDRVVGRGKKRKQATNVTETAAAGSESGTQVCVCVH